jgi:predicted phosphodiesterase
MKLIAIGDIHGRSDWKEIVKNNDFDKVVFIGDYFDTHENIFPKQQIKNFNEIIKCKEKNPDKVVLLLGNHDYHYLPSVTDQYGGFVSYTKSKVSGLLNVLVHAGMIRLCYVHENFLFSHAGVTKTWCKVNHIDLKNIECSINEYFLLKPEAFRFTSGRDYDIYGDEICQTPLWVRPRSLMNDKIAKYIQVVGHTEHEKLQMNGHMIIIDCLRTSKEYLSINNGKLSVKINK